MIITAFAVVALNASVVKPRGHWRFDAPSDSILSTLAFSFFFMLVSLPAIIITNRCVQLLHRPYLLSLPHIRTITTPHKLPYFRPIYSLRLLLTPTERARPWILYLTPGLLASEALHVLYVLIVLHTARRFLLPSLSSYSPRNPDGTSSWELPADFTVIRMGSYALIALASTFVLCPLEVMTIRLSIQRNHARGGDGFGTVAQEEEADVDASNTQYAAAEEDVIGYVPPRPFSLEPITDWIDRF